MEMFIYILLAVTIGPILIGVLMFFFLSGLAIIFAPFIWMGKKLGLIDKDV